ncbi:MAG TPA: LamG-like jellyroll fold domain-containing protein [Candidatus Angelobacter sp.]|nr:LamG-like jellyroll fold domain-containing protein [Candidatus Angelobacter sp.]
MLTNGIIEETRPFRDVAHRIGKLTACLILGAVLLPQVAHSAPNYATTALADNPLAFWQLTETADPSSGAVQANDSSGNGHNGIYGTTSQNAFNGILSPQPPTFQGFTNGQGALQCSAGDATSPVSIPFLNLNTNAVTMTMWINPAGGETASTGLLMNRNGGDAAGFCFGTTLNAFGMAELGYTWNTNAQATWGFNSGLYPASGTWNFVALVVQSNSATIYLCFIDPNTGQTNVLSAINAIAHTPESFSGGNIWLGSDVTAGGGAPDNTRIFAGQISDVAVYTSSLNSDQILALFAAGLGVQGFPPSITQQPLSQYAIAGTKAQLKATGINGTAPISYQWQLNGTNINLLSDSANFTGANSNILTILSASAADTGSYQLILNNAIATTASSNAILTLQTTNLVGEWLDGSAAGTNLLDVSGYSLSTNHGAYFAGSATYVFTNDVPPGKSGQSIFLYNGDTGLVISNSSTLDPAYDDTYDNRINNGITVACWAKGWPGNWNPFLSKYGETTPSPAGGWQLRADAGSHPCWTLRGAGGATNGVALGTADGGNPDDMAASSLTFGNDGVWHFYVGTYNASTGLRDLYVDGTLVASETNTSAYALAAVEHLCIGARDADGSTIANFFTGQLFDVRVYNYALTEPAILQLYGIVPAAVATQPKPVVTFTNSTAQFSIVAAGTAPLTYQWRLNGTNINLLADAANFTGGNSNVLTILSASGADVGAYSVTVSNAFGGGISTNVTLSLVPKLLVGQWFDGGSSLADVSGYQPPGTHDGYDLANGTYSFTNDVPPYKTGSSISLVNDGIGIMNSATGDAAYTNTFDDTINDAMTVAFWAKGYPGNWNPWVSKYGDSGVAPTAGWQLRDSGDNADAAWTMRGTGGTVVLGTPVYGNPEDLRGTIPTADGQWHHYAGTFNAATGERDLYVDGVLSGMETGNQPYTLAADSHVCIGARDQHGGLVGFFTGEIYDVRVYNYSLGSNEIRQIIGFPDPAIVVQPAQAATGYIGLSVQLSAQVTGTTPITNQWQFNGTNITDGSLGGATITGSHSNVLTIANLTSNLQGVFHLIVSNSKGTLISSNSTLTVLPTAAAPGTNLVGAWLAGLPNLADSSGYSPAGAHDGYGVTGTSTPSSAYTFTNDVPPGMGGQALAFNGATGIAISNSSTLDASYTNTFDDTITNAMTVAFWAKGWPSGAWNPWVSKYGESGQGWQLRRNGGTTDSTWTIRGTGGTEDMAGIIGSNDGKWHHYAGTYDATTGERDLYVDGVLSASQTGQGPYTLASSSHLALGARDSGGNNFGNYYGGELYGVRIYNVALSAAQVNSLLLSTNQVAAPPVFGSIIHNGNQFIVNWAGGSLQQATNVTGPWTPTGATSPYTNVISTTNRQMFFRVSSP